MELAHDHNHYLVALSILIAVFASYSSLDLINSLSSSKGKWRWIWLLGASLAMGIGIWSMHFIGMLAFSIPGLDIYYDVPLLVLSIFVAILASALALFLVSSRQPSQATYLSGGIAMGVAISGMHYIGIASMRIAADIHWNFFLVIASLLIAMLSSFSALKIGFRLRADNSSKGFLYRGAGGVLLGLAISGMHYTAMAAMSFTPASETMDVGQQYVLATQGLATAIILGTLVILAIALTGSNIDRALARKNLIAETLKDNLKSRDEFISLASHELKTPITSVKLQIELLTLLLNEEKIDKSHFSSSLQIVNKGVDRINALIEDMLDLSKVKLGKLELDMVHINLNELMKEVLKRFEHEFQMAGVDVNLSSQDVFILGDPFRIEQVFTNLITNAIKYGKGAPIKMELSEVNGKAILRVIDQGIGIPKKFRDKLFQRFERAVSSREASGLGLGLFIVKEIVDAHKGRVWFESEEGKGTVFSVELPLAAGESS